MAPPLRTWMLALALVPVAALLAPRAAGAQGAAPGAVTTTLSVTRAQQFRTMLGEMGGTSLSAGVSWQVARGLSTGISLRYEAQEWPFATPTEFGGVGPWSQLHHPAAALSLGLALSRTLVVGLSPTVEWAGERHTPGRDGLAWGAAASATKILSPRLALGAGANVSRQFYSVKVSPFAIVNWRWTDRLRLANAPAFGPLGSAGIELRYQLARPMEVAVGGVHRGDRYRLDRHHTYPGDVADVGSFPLVARLTFQRPDGSRADLHAGVATMGRLEIKDLDGRRLVSARYPAAPLLAVSLSRRF